ncbi:MAG TPA: hydrogenase small subunit [Coriobacteriia bacterium]|nr:hydrogenase small subunit [Coriobacteriia bacterium]
MQVEESVVPGVSRRDFLKYCSWVAGMIGLGVGGTPRVASAIESIAKRPSVVYGSFQACTGCAIQLLQNREPGVANLILKTISLDYQDNVMAAAGDAAEEVWRQVTGQEGFFFVIEGSIPMGIPGAMTIHGRTAQEIILEAVPNAAGIIAYGSCAAYGNIQASNPNPTGAVGVQEFLAGELGADAPAVINLPRCPGHGDDIVVVLMSVLLTGKLPALDPKGRPLFLYGQTIHDSCFRRGHFEAGEFVEQFGDEHTKDDWCLYKVGCKGPYTYAPCGKALWNGNVSWCVHNAPCQGCAEQGFWDDLTPFYEQPRGGEFAWKVAPVETIGAVVGGATVLGLGAYAVAQNRRMKAAERSPSDAEPKRGGDV